MTATNDSPRSWPSTRVESHTRRRLVRRALDAAPASPRRPRLALVSVAAAVLAVVAVAGIVLLAGGGGSRGPTRAAGPSAPQPGAAARAAPRDLGDVGDVTNPAALRRVLGPSTLLPERPRNSIVGACATLAATAHLARLDAVGTGIDGGQPVVVAVGPDAAGDPFAVAVTAPGCSVLQRVALG